MGGMSNNQTLFFSRMAGLEGVTLVRCTGCPPVAARHAHQSLCIGVVLSGERILSVDGGEIVARSGDVIVFLPGQAHACADSGECTYLMISIPTAWLDEIGLAAESMVARSACLSNPDLYGKIVNLAELADLHSPAVEMEGSLIEILEMLVALDGFGISTNREQALSCQVRTVRRYIETHADEEIRLKTLASLADISPWRLNRLFSSQVGMPPHEFQNMVRVNRVKAMVSDGVELAEAAVAAGYSDQSHMTRCFRKVVGMTPGKYAEGMRPGDSRKM